MSRIFPASVLKVFGSVGKDGRSHHVRAPGTQCPGAFQQGCTSGEDVIDEDDSLPLRSWQSPVDALHIAESLHSTQLRLVCSCAIDAE